MEKKIVFWDCHKHQERLYHDNVADAIYAYLDDIRPNELPEKITVYGWVRVEVDEPDAKYVVERILEDIDEEYGDPDGDTPEITPKMLEASKELIKVVMSEYECWACEEVTEEEIIVADWMKENPE